MLDPGTAIPVADVELDSLAEAAAVSVVVGVVVIASFAVAVRLLIAFAERRSPGQRASAALALLGASAALLVVAGAVIWTLVAVSS